MVTGLEMIVMVRNLERELMEARMARRQQWQRTATQVRTDSGRTLPARALRALRRRVAGLAASWTGRTADRRRPA